MSRRNTEQRLATIERHIEEGRRRIALFEEMIAQMACNGGDTALAQRLLATLQRGLVSLHEIRRSNAAVGHRVEEPAALPFVERSDQGAQNSRSRSASHTSPSSR